MEGFFNRKKYNKEWKDNRRMRTGCFEVVYGLQQEYLPDNQKIKAKDREQVLPACTDAVASCGQDSTYVSNESQTIHRGGAMGKYEASDSNTYL